jgi:hypothetical protein
MPDHYVTLKKCVSFVFLEKESKLIANGTGFFIGLKNKDKEDSFNVFFVTAKHVLQNNGEFHDTVVIRLNKIDGEADNIKISLKSTKLIEHKDGDVDLVAFPCLPDQKVYDFKFIPENIIASKEIMDKNDICEGDDVFFTGLFTSHIGQKKNQPILRFGKVALISDEKIEWKDKKDEPAKLLDLYLMECHSFGGNSGSPVFFSLNPLRKPGRISVGGAQFFLAGIMMGNFQKGNPLQVIQTNTVPVFSTENVGIAAVTPAYKILEALTE